MIQLTDEEAKYVLELIYASPVSLTFKQFVDNSAKPSLLVANLIKKLTDTDLSTTEVIPND